MLTCTWEQDATPTLNRKGRSFPKYCWATPSANTCVLSHWLRVLPSVPRTVAWPLGCVPILDQHPMRWLSWCLRRARGASVPKGTVEVWHIEGTRLSKEHFAPKFRVGLLRIHFHTRSGCKGGNLHSTELTDEQLDDSMHDLLQVRKSYLSYASL